jgi:hypothetical protein
MSMKKQVFLLAAVVMFCSVAFVQAQETDLHGSFDLTYQSQYVWRGFTIFGSKGAIQPSLDVDLFGTGFGVNVMGHIPTSSGYVNAERWDYSLYYQNMLCPDEAHAIMYRLGWVYYNYPDHPTEGTNVVGEQNAALQELHGIVSLPKMCTFGVVPSYVLVKLWPSNSSSYSGSRYPTVPFDGGLVGLDGTASGFAHIFMLDYPLTIGGIVPETPEQVLNLHAEVVFNDGVGPAGQNVDHDWSNAVFGVSTGFKLTEELVLTPGVYHQISMESSVNEDDETWATVSMTYNF